MRYPQAQSLVEAGEENGVFQRVREGDDRSDAEEQTLGRIGGQYDEH